MLYELKFFRVELKLTLRAGLIALTLQRKELSCGKKKQSKLDHTPFRCRFLECPR
jgi:hypothetical protein